MLGVRATSTALGTLESDAGKRLVLFVFALMAYLVMRGVESWKGATRARREDRRGRSVCQREPTRSQ